MSSVVQTLSHLAEPWRSAYSASTPLAITVLFAHLGALLLGGGLAVASDRMVLRLGGADAVTRSLVLRELGAVHSRVVAALVVLFVSGVLLAAADVETFAKSPTFWVKMALVTALLANGAVLYRTGSELRRADSDTALARWARLRVTSVVSLVLWTATVLAGTVLVSAA